MAESTDSLALSPVSPTDGLDREAQLEQAAARAMRHGSRFAEDLGSQLQSAPPDLSRMRTDSDATIRRAPSMDGGGPFADSARFSSTRDLVSASPDGSDEEDDADEFAGRSHEPLYRSVLRAWDSFGDSTDCPGVLCCAGSRETEDDEHQAGATMPSL